MVVRKLGSNLLFFCDLQRFLMFKRPGSTTKLPQQNEECLPQLASELATKLDLQISKSLVTSYPHT